MAELEALATEMSNHLDQAQEQGSEMEEQQQQLELTAHTLAAT
eukprot:SAG11_NODE_25789_length_354_cov_0.603922_2_plen_42_part_01